LLLTVKGDLEGPRNLGRSSGVTFSGAGSYIVRAMKAARRPGKEAFGERRGRGCAWAGGGKRRRASACGSGAAGSAEFEALYELHFERVYAFVASRVRDRATAEDVTSEVFHKGLA